MKGNSARKPDSNSGDLLGDLVPVREAAEALGISESTAWRWIDKHLLPAFRVGEKRVYVKRSDLGPLIKPARLSKGPTGPKKKAKERMSERDRRRWIKALAESKKLRDEMFAARGGRPWIPSDVLLNEARDERTEQLG
jgi:excisionase family DNA binding protein